MRFNPKLSKFKARLKTGGASPTLRYYSNLLVARSSPNYALNQSSVLSMPPISRALYIISDIFKAHLDRFFTFFVNFCSKRREIPMKNLEMFSFYYLDPRLLNNNSIIYSFGVGNNIDFDRSVAEKFKSNVYLFDPTPLAKEFMAHVNRTERNPLLRFESTGIWTESGKLKFYLDRRSSGSTNLSIVNIFNTDKFFEAECKTIEDIMAVYGHKEVDVLKLDIEGAALPVLESMLSSNLLPKQIVAELEIPKFIYGASLMQVLGFIASRRRLFRRLSQKGYKIFTYGKAEFLAVIY